MTQAEVPEIHREEHDSDSGNIKQDAYYWDTNDLQWNKLSGTNNGIKITA